MNSYFLPRLVVDFCYMASKPDKYGQKFWLALAAINAWILYRLVTNLKISRRSFLFQLSEVLTNANVMKRKGQSKTEDNADGIREEKQTKRKKCQVRTQCKKDTKGVH